MSPSDREVFHIPVPHVPEYWPRVRAYLQGALDRSVPGWEIGDVYNGLLQETLQLWVVFHGKEVEAALVTEIAQYPRGRLCRYFLIGGKNAPKWTALAEEKIDLWAREIGCFGVTATGRKGWKRHLPKWRICGTSYIKEFDDGK